MQLEINEQQKELKSHGRFDFPVSVNYEILSNYEHGSFIWHCHPEIELTLILNGTIQYQVNNQTYLLSAGDGLFCNSNALHTGHMHNNEDCHYLSITFHPRIIYGYEGSVFHHSYITPLLSCDKLDSIPLYSSEEWQYSILTFIKEISDYEQKRSIGYEFQIQQRLSQIWFLLYKNKHDEILSNTGQTTRSLDLDRLRNILSFIQSHYAEKITLSDISAQISICNSECCRLFKKYMQQSLFDYLLYYRIEKSLPLLKENRLSITEIAELTGFSSPGYFSRVFRNQIHCTPSQYRKRISV